MRFELAVLASIASCFLDFSFPNNHTLALLVDVLVNSVCQRIHWLGLQLDVETVIEAR